MEQVLSNAVDRGSFNAVDAANDHTLDGSYFILTADPSGDPNATDISGSPGTFCEFEASVSVG